MCNRLFLGAAFATAMAGLSPIAHAQDGLLKNALNNPAADQWAVSGTSDKKVVKDADVNGGWAYQITTTGPGANPWDVGAGVATTRAIHKDDVVLLAFWAKGGTPGAHLNASVQVEHAPYARLADFQTLGLSPAWKLYYVSFTSPFDLAAGDAGASLQLATGAQTIDLGPVFILDFGPGYDLNQLPKN